MSLAQTGAWLAAASVSLPLLVVTVECLIGLISARRRPQPATAKRPEVAVLVPAHNEAGTLAATLARIRRQLRADDQLLVVADNCTDDTAAIARRCGAEVVERNDPQHRGKGYALAAGVNRLRHRAPEVVLIVDADCNLEENAVDRLAAQVVHTRRPAQAIYLMRPARGRRRARGGFRICFYGQKQSPAARAGGARPAGAADRLRNGVPLGLSCERQTGHRRVN